MSIVVPEYVPKALYFEEADSLEYVRSDSCHVYRRIDRFLTLILDMDSRMPIGFKIKGFKNLYLKTIQPRHNTSEAKFLHLKVILEDVMTEIGHEVFASEPKNEAYRIAAEIAENDEVLVSDLPRAA